MSLVPPACRLMASSVTPSRTRVLSTQLVLIGLGGVALGVQVRDVVDGVSDSSSGSGFCASSRMARRRSGG